MKTLVNGRESASIAVQDRGLHYGDGLFETIAVRHGRPRFLPLHLERLAEGCARLALPLPAIALLESEVASVVEADEQVVKVILTRGPAGRGYRIPAGAEPTRIVSAYPDHRTRPVPAAGVRVRTCETRLGTSPALAGLKHLGRLEQVLARSEWQDAQVEEGLMLDTAGRAVCGTQTNLFVVRGSALLTPRLDRCGVAGVMRRAVLHWARSRCMVAREEDLEPADLHAAEEVFLTNALVGAWPVAELDGKPLRTGSVARTFNAWLEGV